VEFEGGWALVRASNTQPVLVMRFEASNENQIEKFKEFTREHLKNVWPEGKLP
ncbi:MAG: phosphomannomutase, partial [Deltaproteobacteria bacterium]|nr:phosphomannomutase [Deltaproteobacteria bacterium]